jgi:hypothetical protein
MSTLTRERHIARLRDRVAEAERLMAIHYGTPLFATYLAQRGAAVRELRQMGVSAR